ITPVPGVGVYVRKPNERIAAAKAKKNKTEQPAWRKLDLATGEMPLTDVRLAQMYIQPAEDNGHPRMPDPFTRVSLLAREDPDSTAQRPMTQLEIYPVYTAGTEPVTQPLVYGRVLGKPHEK